MLLGAVLGGRSDLRFWLVCGGDVTLDSYGTSRQLDLIPREHRRFVETCCLAHETDTHFFVHASYNPPLPLDRQDRTTLLWRPLHALVPGPHVSGKIAVVGHTPQMEGTILDLGHLVCIDTGCCYGGWLTALDVATGQVWQADAEGRVRT
jgi:serine/threonine protein phosphatase 1